MKINKKLLSAAMALPIALGGMLTSCEDTCNNCNCDNFKIDYIVTSDSDSALAQLSAEQTVIIKGSGLSSTREVYLVDSLGVLYNVYLNPAYVTDENVIITMDCDANMIPTEKVLLVSTGGCRVEYAINKPVPSPSIKMFYSEFVPDGDTLRVLGSAFISDAATNDTLKIWFQSQDGATIVNVSSYKVGHDNTELLIVVPAGVADNSNLCVENSHGRAVSKVLFRDTRNIFLDFDTEIATDWRGAMDTFAYKWNPAYLLDHEADYADLLQRMGNEFPKPCNGFYNALTLSDAYSYKTGENEIFLAQYTQDPTKPKKNLMGPFESMPVDNLCLKFEIYVPESIPYASHMYIMFTGYQSEDETLAESQYGVPDVYLPRDLNGNGTEGATYNVDANSVVTCLQSRIGVPAAWFHPGVYKYNPADDVAGYQSSFYTKHGWMTVTIPLNRANFCYSPKDRGIFTENYVACHTLDATDMYNFFINTDDVDSYQKKKGETKSSYMFVGFDNFRIVPEDNGGSRFDKYNGMISGYPY